VSVTAKSRGCGLPPGTMRSSALAARSKRSSSWACTRSAATSSSAMTSHTRAGEIADTLGG